MNKDVGPRHNLGYGLEGRDLTPAKKDNETPNPESGIIAKKLHDHPVMKFFAVSAASIAAAHVAGKVISKGTLGAGFKALEYAESHPSSLINTASDSYKRIVGILDELEGVERSVRKGNDLEKLIFKDETGEIVSGFELKGKRQGYFFTKAEREQASELGIESDAVWGAKQEIQQRLIKQARRLPYELPAMYGVQKAVIDPLSGENESKRKVHWNNPIDVITNFVTESTKNLAFAILPFEAAGGGATSLKRSALSYGDDMVIHTANQRLKQDMSVSLNVILGQVGADAADILNKGLRLSSQSSGAFSAGVQAARDESMHFRHFASSVKERAAIHSPGGSLRNVTGVKNTVKAVMFNDTGSMNRELIDQLPGPFRGSSTGIRAARTRFGEIGKGFDALDALMARGGTPAAFKKAGFINPLTGEGDEAAARKAMQFVRRGGTELEDLAGDIESIGKGGPGTNRWKTGIFYKDQIQSQYQKTIARQLVKEGGVSEAAALKFTQISKIKPPSSTLIQNEREISSRIIFGEDALFVDNVGSNLNNAIYKRLGMISDPSDAKRIADNSDAKRIADNLTKVMGSTDTMFRNKAYRQELDTKIGAMWNFNRNKLIPQIGEGILPKAKLAYNSFDGDITYAQQSYLKRKSASVLGIKLMDEHGVRVSDDIVSNELAHHGFNTSGADGGKHELRAFLATNKKIGMPWASGGANLFGFKPLLASEALSKGYMATSKEANDEMQSLLGSMKQFDPVSRVVGDYALPGAYVTASGKILDTGAMKRSVKRGFNTVASELQIPIVGIKPFELFASKFFKAKQDRNIFQYVSGHTPHPFLKSEAQAADEFYIWSRTGGRGYKGQVHAVSLGNEGVSSRKLAGLYEAGATDSYQMGARRARLAAGESGKVPFRADGEPVSNTRKRVDGVKKLFNFSPNQEKSLVDFAQRFKGRKTDVNNPYVMAKLLRDGEVTTRANKYVLKGGALVNAADDSVKASAEKVATAFEKNFNNRYLRNFGLPTRAIKSLENNSNFKHLFELNFTGEKPRTFAAGKIKISELQSEAQISEAMELHAVQGLKLAKTLKPEAAAALKRSDDALLWRYLDNSGGPSYWDEAAPQSARSGTISTRLDQAKADLYKSSIMREAIAGGDDFASVLPQMAGELHALKVRGVISGAEYSEASTALLSLQVNFTSFKGFNRKASSLDNIKNLMADISGNPDIKKLLSEVAEGNVGVTQSGILSKMTPGFRRNLSVSAHEFDGMEYNPFGTSDTTLFPTIGTAFNRNPRQAMMSILGINSWNNPDAFSAASIPMSHMLERLNRFGGALNMGLETGAFKGPLDFYARGVVGQRVLPITAAGAAFMTADRTVGGLVHGKDENGERQYTPIVTGALATGVAHAEAAWSGLIPGGPTYKSKIDEIKNGDVAIRSGRYFPLGNTPWQGGQIKYYRPSWYKKFMSGHMYTSDTYGSPLERFAFGYDFSPLKPFSPYHYENKHYEDRPYPVSGEYFTGPWGPLAPALNMTIGKLLKPEKKMHEEELKAGLTAYTRQGDYGAVFSPLSGMGSQPGMMAIDPANAAATTGGSGVGYGTSQYAIAASNRDMAQSASGPAPYASGSTAAALSIAAGNQQNAKAGAGTVRRTALPVSPNVVAATPAITQGSMAYQAGNFGYHAQELLGIYGFMFGAARESLGLGTQDFTNTAPVLRSSSKMTSSSRSFWELNVGGLGDAPLSIEGDLGNVEFSEIVRRFVPKERTDVDYINPILNTMNQKAPWLPGSNYFTDFKTGDPFTAVEEGEMRLPGVAYERLHGTHPDATGKYGMIDRLSILGDVAPYSDEYKAMLSQASEYASPSESRLIAEIDRKVQTKKLKHEFTPYRYKYQSADDMGIPEVAHQAGRLWEKLAHANSLINTKFLPNTTAVEDWERNNIYGSTFPQWQNPINDFIKPMVYNASQRNPIVASLVLGTAGSLFAHTAKGKAVGAVVGGTLGFVSSSLASIKEKISGERYLPTARKKEIALEENADILTYIKNKRLESEAKQMGDDLKAEQFSEAASRTMYGADIYSGDVNKLASAVPNRKREHFKAMMFAPKEERGRILSTAGRLERRMYQAAWGYDVEEKPDLGEYFQTHELPSADSEMWMEDTSMEYVKIKMGQSMGLDMSQMGYYPQQVKEANLVNPTYPSFTSDTSKRNVQAELQRIMDARGINGRIVKSRNYQGGDQVNISAGVY